MKAFFRIFATGFFAVLFMASSTPYSTTPPKIGTFSLYRTLSESDVIAHFGNPTETSTYMSEDENGEIMYITNYESKTNNVVDFSIQVIRATGRIDGFAINKRDPKYAINGILMVGDPLSKLEQLGYQVTSDSYTLSQNYVVVYLPAYRKNDYDYCYYLEVSYDSNKIIKHITMQEEQGI